jgi:hypothetical protein
MSVILFGIALKDIHKGEVVSESDLAPLNQSTRDWEMRAARGECAWICSSCCVTFPEGMPDRCPHSDDNGCTDLIKRDRAEAQALVKGEGNG